MHLYDVPYMVLLRTRLVVHTPYGLVHVCMLAALHQM